MTTPTPTPTTAPIPPSRPAAAQLRAGPVLPLSGGHPQLRHDLHARSCPVSSPSVADTRADRVFDEGFDGRTYRMVDATVQCPRTCWMATGSRHAHSCGSRRRGAARRAGPVGFSSPFHAHQVPQPVRIVLGHPAPGLVTRRRRRIGDRPRTSSRYQRNTKSSPSSVGTHRGRERIPWHPFRTARATYRTAPPEMHIRAVEHHHLLRPQPGMIGVRTRVITRGGRVLRRSRSGP